MRAIDADAFEVVAYKGIPEGYSDTFGDGVEWILEKIDRMPTIEPERKKGKWIKENIVLTTCPTQYQWHCSECGRILHWFNTEVLTNFCPNCGADMREET